VSEPFLPLGDGGVAVRLGGEERALLASLPAFLGSVGAVAGDPATERLTPPAYLDDDAAQQEFARLTAAELTAWRREDRSRFVASLGADRLDEPTATAWLRVMGDVRLALAARNGVEDETWEELGEHDPELGLVAWLGLLQGALLRALAAGEETGA